MPRIKANRSPTTNAAIEQETSTLNISRNEVPIGSSIIISWDIKGPCLENDWIGLFYSDDDNTDNSIACFHRYKDVYRKGKYSWLIREFDNEFGKATSRCCFRYYNSTSQILRAVSPTFVVYNPNVENPFYLQEEIVPTNRNRKFAFELSDIRVNGLKRRLFSKPSTNIVVAVMPRCLLHHKSNSSFKRSTPVQSKTTEPYWSSEIFRFQARVFDVLQLEVRDSENLYRSKFVGKIGIPFIEIFKVNLTKNEASNYTCRLCDKSGSKYVSGWISFVLTQIPVDGSGLTISLSMSGLSNVPREFSEQIKLSQNKESRPFQNILLDQNWLQGQRDSVNGVQSSHSTEEVIHNINETENDRNSSRARNGIDSTDMSRPDNLVINETFENNENVLAQQYNVTSIANHDSDCTSNHLNSTPTDLATSGNDQENLPIHEELQNFNFHTESTSTITHHAVIDNQILEDSSTVYTTRDDISNDNNCTSSGNTDSVERLQLNSTAEYNQNHSALLIVDGSPTSGGNFNLVHSSHDSASANSSNTCDTYHQSDVAEASNDNVINEYSTHESNGHNGDIPETTIISTDGNHVVSSNNNGINDTGSSGHQWINLDIETGVADDLTQLPQRCQDISSSADTVFESSNITLDNQSSLIQDDPHRNEFATPAINLVTAAVSNKTNANNHVAPLSCPDQVINDSPDFRNVVASENDQHSNLQDATNNFGVVIAVNSSQMLPPSQIQDNQIISCSNQDGEVHDPLLISSHITIHEIRQGTGSENQHGIEPDHIPILNSQISELQRSSIYLNDQVLEAVNPNFESHMQRDIIIPQLNVGDDNKTETIHEDNRSSTNAVVINAATSHVGSDNQVEINNYLLANESFDNSIAEQNQSSTESPNHVMYDGSNLINRDESTRNIEHTRDDIANRDMITQSAITHDESSPVADYPPCVESAESPVNIASNDTARNNENARDVIAQSVTTHDESSPTPVYPPYIEGAESSVDVASNNNLVTMASEENWYEASSDIQTEHENNNADLGNGSYASALRAASSVLYQNSTPVTNDWQDQSNLSNSSAVVDTSNSRWEKRTDMYGREFYYNRDTHVTEWASTLPETSSEQTLIQRRRRLDERYVSLRRAISKSSRNNRTNNQAPDNKSHDGNISQNSDVAVATLIAVSPPSGNQTPTQGDLVVDNNSFSEISTPNTEPVSIQQPDNTFNSLATNISMEGMEPKRDDSHAQSFLMRPDLMELVDDHTEANTLYNREKPLRQAILKIRRGAAQFDKYRKSRRMVAFLNCFVDTSQSFPSYLIVTQQDNGTPLFYNTRANSVSVIDPRLGMQFPLQSEDSTSEAARHRQNRNSRATRRIPEVSSNNTRQQNATINSSITRELAMAPIAVDDVDVEDEQDTSYGAQVAAFLSRPNIFEVLKSKYPGINTKRRLRSAIEAIRKDGKSAVERFSNNSDLVVMLSLFESEITSNRLAASSSASTVVRRKVRKETAADEVKSYREKMLALYRKLGSLGFGKGPERLRLKIRRKRLLEDAFNQIIFESTKCLQKNKLEVQFVGEDGLDYGGLAREFFFLLSRELFNPVCGLFEYSANDTYTIQVSPKSTYVDHWHDWFRFCGRVIGMAIVHRYLLDAFFARPFYKNLLERPCNIADLEFVDEQYHRSITWIIDNEITDDLAVPFSISYDVFGEKREYELKPNGKNIYVSESNKKEYVELFLKWRLEQSISEQMKPILKGFHDIVSPEMLSSFDANELELLICGTHDVDVDDWIKNTEYRSGYSEDHQVIVWFWEAVRIMSNEKRLRLLQFITGTSSLPVEGFAALRGSSGLRKFCIDKLNSVDKLPRAHTCFNRLDLPAYPSYKVLYKKLVLAIDETNNFGIE